MSRPDKSKAKSMGNVRADQGLKGEMLGSRCAVAELEASTYLTFLEVRLGVWVDCLDHHLSVMSEGGAEWRSSHTPIDGTSPVRRTSLPSFPRAVEARV